MFAVVDRRRWHFVAIVGFLSSYSHTVNAFSQKAPALDRSQRDLETSVLHAVLNEPLIDDATEVLPKNPVMSRSGFFACAALTALVAPAMAQAALEPSVTTLPHENHSIPSSSLELAAAATAPAAATATTTTTMEPTSFQESVSGFVAGAALSAIKTLVKYPLDTVTVRLQVPSSSYSMTDLNRLFRGSYNGVALSLVSSIPGGAIFFAVKDATKASLKANLAAAGTALPKWAITTVAVGAALIPYWAIRNPSEVIKVRQQVGAFGENVSALDAVQQTWNGTERNGDGSGGGGGWSTLYTGYWENIIYGLPADVLKFVAYEALTGGRTNLSPLEGARAGALATATAQLVTTPLDVVRNRLMTRTADPTFEPWTEEDQAQRRRPPPPPSYWESLVALGKEEGLGGLFSGASPRVAKAFLSGAIQFATYEETKQSISRMLLEPRQQG